MNSNTLLIIALVAIVGLAILGLVLRRKSQVSQPVIPTSSVPKVAEPSAATPTELSEAPANPETTAPPAEHSTQTVTEISQPVDQPESESVESAQPSTTRSDFGKSRGSLTAIFKSVFNRSNLDDEAWQDLEDALIMADMGAASSALFIEQLRQKIRSQNISTADELFSAAQAELISVVDGNLDRTLNIAHSSDGPAVVLTVGVNGTGKTTTTGKLAKFITGQDREVLLGAADTFRAAAADQLTTWGDRVGAVVVRGPEGSDPASVAFEAIDKGYAEQVDVVLIDTAGRLHTKQGLMDELGKVYRVCTKRGPVAEVLLVIDATTGQNGLAQAKVFSEVVPVTGVVLSKLDGTAKGGIVVAVQQALRVPVKLVGLGEGPDDLAPFNPEDFVAGLLA